MVEWKKLGEIAKITNGERPILEILEKGKYPYINAGRTNSGYINDFNSEKGAITTPSHGEGGIGSVMFQKQNFWCGALCYKIYVDNNINNRYLFHYLSKNSRLIFDCKNVGGLPYINRKQLEKIAIEIPSLSEQNHIVGILDTFTDSIENLKQQIAQRRKQYEFYRDQLLDFEGKEGVEMKTLGEIFSFKNGLNKGKEFFGEGRPIIMFSNVFNSRYIDSSKINSKVNITDKELERIDAKYGDVFFTRTSETKEDVGYASVLLEDVGECTFAGFLIRARPLTYLLEPSYCKYCFSTPSIRRMIVENSSFTTRASLTGAGLGKIRIPVPPLSEQQRIVSILDAFEASISNLEAQLAQRQNQYEYYRNKLLTFD